MKNFAFLASRAAAPPLLLLLASACTSDDRAPASPPVQLAAVGSSSGVPTSPPPDPAVACPGTRQVGVNPSPGSGCPTPSDVRWQPVQLFQHGNAPELAAFCVYDWTSPTQAPRLDLLPTAGLPSASDWLVSDCEVVTTFGSTYTTRNAARLEQAFSTQVEAVPLISPITSLPTRVVVVDSAVDASFPSGGDGRLDHGRAMGAIIRNLACPQAGGVTSPVCAAGVASSLALPLVETANGTVVDRVNGGYLGRLTDVAAAIHDGLHHGLAQSGPPRIIINLSLGWDDVWGGDLSLGWTNLPATHRAVFSALREASCRGAIVIAAAGNSTGGQPTASGPAYPGGWEVAPAPNVAGCAALGGGPVLGGTSTYRPLLYAVSGVNGADRPLISERYEGRARLVAPAAHALVSQPPAYVSEALTGSSVATAVTSAAAALIWAYHPSLRPHDVMELLYDSAVDLSFNTDVCLNGPPCTDTARRVSICRAVHDACLASATCGPPACPLLGPGRDERVTGIDVSLPLPTTSTVISGLEPYVPGAPCAGVIYANPQTATNPCPSDQFLSRYSVPSSVPQPIGELCPTCKLADQTLFLEIGDDLEGVLSDATLVVLYEDGTKESYVLDGIGELQAGETAEVEVQDLSGGTIEQASIEFVHDEDFAVAEELIIE